MFPSVPTNRSREWPSGTRLSPEQASRVDLEGLSTVAPGKMWHIADSTNDHRSLSVMDLLISLSPASMLYVSLCSSEATGGNINLQIMCMRMPFYSSMTYPYGAMFLGSRLWSNQNNPKKAGRDLCVRGVSARSACVPSFAGPHSRRWGSLSPIQTGCTICKRILVLGRGVISGFS